MTRKYRDIIELLVSITIVVLVGYISSFYFHRFDLTSEKRHTLTETTTDLMADLDDVVYVQVYLAGDLPADYQRLQQAIKERLDEMRAYSDDNLQYEFINPSASDSKTAREKMYGELIQKGLEYSSLQIRTKDGIKEQIIFPGALVSYRDKVQAVQILKNRKSASDGKMVNKAINNLEYELVNAIQQAVEPVRREIVFLEGHGELTAMQTRDLARELEASYNVGRVRLDGQVNALSKNIGSSNARKNKYDLLIIAKPDSAFSEKDKYIIDQFVMNGGKILWLLDPMQVDLDSLRSSNVTMAVARDINLDDMLFNYGVRLNHNLLLDRSCAPIKLLTGPPGNERYELMPWYFSPIIIPRTTHPIASNIDPVITEFVSSIDTVANGPDRKTILLRTSPYTRIFNSPARVGLGIVAVDMDFQNTTTPNQPVAVLLEGTFKSNFADRMAPEFLSQGIFDFTEKSDFNRMMVVADGDVARNDVSPDGTKFGPLGYDPYTRSVMYGNKEFLVNAVNYLLGDAGLISVRSRTIELRKLDEEQVLQQRSFWQFINIAVPVLLAILMGVVQFIIRKKKYGGKSVRS